MQQKRELIKAGMGRALTGKEDGEFEIVAAPDSDVENNSEGAYDPRDEECVYGSRSRLRAGQLVWYMHRMRPRRGCVGFVGSGLD